MASGIFINYRRDDSAGAAGRIYDRLAQAFGKDNIFMDVDNISTAVNFVQQLERELTNCKVFLCVVGHNWLNAKGEDGHRRLDQPDDYVRTEIAASIKRDITIIPILIDGARMPKPRELPDDIAPLAARQALDVNSVHFQRDVNELTQIIREFLQKDRQEVRGLNIAIASSIALFAIALFLYAEKPSIFFGPPSEDSWDHLFPFEMNQKRKLEMAADQGDPLAMIDLGLHYINGGGKVWYRDYSNAKRLFESAAAKGAPAAMIYLGDLYRDGLGVTKSIVDARTWYQKAQAAGSADAEDRLAKLPSE